MGRSFWVVGLALFAMFFGAGNLIFPLYVGQISQDHSLAATAGFLLMGVVVPFSGVVAMVLYRGDYTAFFRCVGGRLGFILTLILLTIWIPLGSAPRCITLAHASLASHFATPSLWIFSIGYCAIVGLLTYQKSRVISVLGYFLTPLLLLCLSIVILKGIWGSPHEVGVAAESGLQLAARGVKEGYNTMDLIASFFFSASILTMLGREKAEKNPLRTTLLASLVGMGLLCLVYVGLIQLAASHSEILITVPKDRILPYLAKMVLGPKAALASSFAILLACLTTSIALTVVYVDFLVESCFRNKRSNHVALSITLLITFGMSIFGLHGITMVTNPILQFFYPLLIAMICFNIARQSRSTGLVA